MSWSVTGRGTKAAVLKQIDRSVGAMAKQCAGTQQAIEYEAAATTLSLLVGSAPDGHLIEIEAYGSASYGAYPSMDAKINIKLLAPNITE